MYISESTDQKQVRLQETSHCQITYSNTCISIFQDKYNVTTYFMTMLNKMGPNMGRNVKNKVKKYGKYGTKYQKIQNIT